MAKLACPICGAAKTGMADHLRDKHGQVGPQASQTLVLAQPAHRTAPRPPPKQDKPRAAILPCPECNTRMKLKEGKFGLFYGCPHWPRCPGSHGAHADGTPLGTPADQETKKLRQAAHAALDVLWEPGSGQQVFASRSRAYEWMQVTLGLSSDDAHIGKFDATRCKKLIEALWTFEEAAVLNP